MKNVLIGILFCCLLGCTSIKNDFIFDGSTEATTQAGVSKVLKRLKPKDRTQFTMALMAIQFSDVTSAYDVVGAPTMLKVNYFIIGKKINGLNYEQVLALAKKSPTKVSIVQQ